MPKFIEIRRVTVIVETSQEDTIVRELLRLGAKGYTSIYCTGKGRHGVLADLMAESPLVQIQVMARPPVAEAIMKYLHGAKIHNHPTLGVMDTVTVYADDSFF
jgi:hypothetical protein